MKDADHLKVLEKRVAQLEARNRRVETEKTWETSWTRRGAILLLTYGSVTLFFWASALPQPWFAAIVPTLGFLLSTLSLPFVRRWWLRK